MVHDRRISITEGCKLTVRFLVRLRNLQQLTPKDIPGISEKASLRLASHQAQVGNIRVAPLSVELDLFPSNLRDAAALAHQLEMEFGEILTFRQLDLPTTPPESGRRVVTLSRRLFNEERFWETHEEVEALWKTKMGDEKELLQGFILVAVAFVHLQKDEKEICLSVLRRALGKLENKRDEYEGLNLTALRKSVKSILDSGMPEPFKV